MFKVLLVEDSSDSYQLVNRALGGSVHLEWARTQREASTLLEKKDFDLILLDVMLPDGNGFQLCSVLQTHERWKNIPVILLTAKSSVHDKVMAFSIGADDHISKPFDSMELKARVDARLRKRERLIQASDTVICNDIEINKRTQKVRVMDSGENRELDLTPMEFKILLLMASKPNVVLTREEILNKVWGENIHVYNRSVDTHVSKLRKKLGSKGENIVSVHGTGYRFVSEATEKPVLNIDNGAGPDLRFGRSG